MERHDPPSPRTSRWAVALAVLLTAVLLPVRAATADDPTTTTPPYALASVGESTDGAYGDQDLETASPDRLYPFTDASGNLGVASYTPHDHTLTVQSYDPTTLAPVPGTSHTVDLSAWPVWGGFYAAPDGHFYLTVGQDNPDENDALNVVAVMRYDPGWTLLGTAYVKGDATQAGVEGVYQPFEAGRAAMVLDGSTLVVHMARTIYAIGGVHHQTNLTVQVDTTTMTAQTFDEIGGPGGVSYTSHSFNQFVTMDGSSLIMVDQGDAFPRAIQMGVMADFPASRTVSDYDVFAIGGDEGNNYTGVALSGVVATGSGVLIAGDSVPQPIADGQNQDSAPRDVFVVDADPATGATTVEQLTHFSSAGGTTALAGRIAQVAANRYVMLNPIRTGFSYSTDYWLLDDQGDVLAHKTFPDVAFTDTTELHLIGSRLYWAGLRPDDVDPDGLDPSPAYLFAMDVTDPTRPVMLGVTTPAAPSGVVATETKSGTGRVTWSPPATDGGSPVTGYVVTVSVGTIKTRMPASARRYAVDGLPMPADEDNGGFSIAAINANGIGQADGMGIIDQHRPAGTPAAVGGWNASWSGGTCGASLTLSWSPPSDNGGSPITGYEVTATPDPVRQSAGAGATSATVTGLLPGWTYTISVAAKNARGTGTADTTQSLTEPGTKGTCGSATHRRLVAEAPPRIVGTARVGRTLSVRRGTWNTAVHIRYRWYAGGRPVARGTSARLHLTRALRGERLSVRLTVSAAGYLSRTVKVSGPRVR